MCPPTLGVVLRAAMVLPAHVDALHDDATGFGLDMEDFARLIGLVLPRDHNDLVAAADVHPGALSSG